MTRTRRSTIANTAERIDAVARCPLIHRMGDIVETAAVGRRRRHPDAAHLAFGALSRLWRSGARPDADLPGLWDRFRDGFNEAAEEAGTAPIDPAAGPIAWHHYRRGRDRFTEPETLDAITEVFTTQSLIIARDLGLLLPKGPGSLTRPHPSRTIYGDGTIVRPIYRTTSELDTDEDDHPGRRVDPDAADHVRHDGTISGTNLVAVSARGPGLHERVVLRADRVPAPGQEAATAVATIKEVWRLAGPGIQAVTYDGAFQGTHIEDLMSSCGLVVVNKVAAAPTPRASKQPGQRDPKHHLLGVHTHQVGRRQCRHSLVARDGAIVQADLDEAGDTVLSDPLDRVQVKRTRRPGGGWRFTLGVKVTCRHGDFTVWLSPHPRDGDPHRPENLRLIAPADDHFQDPSTTPNRSTTTTSAPSSSSAP